MLLLKLLSPSAYAPNVTIATADAISARFKPSLCLLLLFSHSVISDSLQPHGLQHARLPCSSPSPKVCSNSCPWSRWCYITISSSATPFSFCLQSFPASGSFTMISTLYQVAKVLELQLHHQSFQWIFNGSLQFYTSTYKDSPFTSHQLDRVQSHNSWYTRT